MNELPVETAHVEREYWIREVPYVNIPKFDIRLPSLITEDMLTLITGYLIKELQDQAHVDKVRLTLHNLSVVNNRQNECFLAMLRGSIDYTATRLLRITEAETEESIIREAVVVCVKVAAGRLIQQYPILMRELNTLQKEEYNAALVLGSTIHTEVYKTMYDIPNRFNPNQNFNQRQQPQQQPVEYRMALDPQGYPYVEEGTDIILYTDGYSYYHPSQIGAPVETYRVPQPQYNQPQYGSGRSQDFYNRRPEPQSFGTSWASRANNAPIVNNDRFGAGVVNEPVKSTVTRTTVNNRTEANVATSFNKPSASIKEESIADSGNSLTWGSTANQPYPLCYDPFAGELYRVKENDTISHVIKEREEEITLDYLQHELRPELRAKYRRDLELAKQRMAKKDQPLAVLENQSMLSEKISKIDPAEENTVLFPETIYVEAINKQPIMGRSINEGILIAEKLLRENKLSPKTTFTFDMLVTKDFAITEIDQAMINEIKLSEKDFSAVSGILTVFQSRAEKPSRLWYILADMLKDQVNKVLKFGLGSGIVIDNFVEDSVSVIQYVEKTLGKTAASIFESKQVDIIIKVLSEITVTGEPPATDINFILAEIKELVAVTVLPVTAMELKINFDKQNYGLVSSRVSPDLYRVSNSMLLGKNFLDKIVIVTSDNVVLEVHRGLLVTNSVILSL